MASKKASKAKAAGSPTVGEYMVCRDGVPCNPVKAHFQPIMADEAALAGLRDSQGGRCFACGQLRELDQLRAMGVA